MTHHRTLLRCLTVFVLVCFSGLLYSQPGNISGTWSGTYLLPGVPNAHIILNLTQSGSTLRGSSKIYSDMDSMYVIYAVEGTIKGNEVVLNDAGVIKQNSRTNNYWCKRISIGKIETAGDSLVFRANVNSTGYGFSGSRDVIKIEQDCAPGKFTAYKGSPRRVRPVRLAITDRGIADHDRVTITFNGKQLNDIYHRALLDVELTRNPLYADVVLSSSGPNLLEVVSTSTGQSASSTLLVTFWNSYSRKQQRYAIDCSPGKNAEIALDQ